MDKINRLLKILDGFIKREPPGSMRTIYKMARDDLKAVIRQKWPQHKILALANKVTRETFDEGLDKFLRTMKNPFVHMRNPNIKEQVIDLWGRGYSLAQISKKLNITIDMLDKDLSRLPQAIQSGKFTTRPGYTPPYYQKNPSKKKNPAYLWGFDYSDFHFGKDWKKFLKAHKFSHIGSQLKAGFEIARKRGEDPRHHHWLNKDGVYMITELYGLVPPGFAAKLGYVGLAATDKRALLKVVKDFKKKALWIKGESPWSRDFI